MTARVCAASLSWTQAVRVMGRKTIACADCVSVLLAANWLPRNAAADFADLPVDGDLLPGIVEVWQRWNAIGRRDPPRRAAVVGRLPAWQRAGAQLTYTAARQLPDRAAERLGKRLIWWPQGVPPGRRLAVLSSRLGRHWDRHRVWFAALRQVCAKLSVSQDMLLAAEGTAAARAVQRAARLAGLPVLLLITPREAERPESWLRAIGRQQPPAGRTAAPYVASLSPLLAPPPPCSSTTTPAVDAPLRDRALVALSDELFVLSVRRRGNVESLVRTCLVERVSAHPFVRIADDPRLVRPTVLREFLQLGAAAEMIEPFAPLREAPPAPPADRIHQAAPIIDVPSVREWPYLSHWTRAATLAWPGESEDDYLDGLLRGDPNVDHSAFGTLQRIVREQRLRATATTIRGGAPVVCFTAVPLQELTRHHVFRPHRGRWDFEFYGISIRRSYLEQAGARPVYYGDHAAWDGLPAALKPFFQLRRTQGRRATIDWTGEREWRHLGTLDLSPLSARDALLFVPSQAEALLLAETSRWPIVVLSD